MDHNMHAACSRVSGRQQLIIQRAKPRGDNMKPLALGFCIALLASQAWGQAAFPPPPPKVSPVVGVIDMHVHSHPDVFGRNMDDIDVATLAKSRGLRGILLKNHISETASRAALVMKVVPGIEVFGGIGLNNAAGGTNREEDAVSPEDRKR